MKPAIPNTFRHSARIAINEVIADHVLGPVQLLPREDILELRKVLRKHYPFAYETGYPLKIWREEIRAALGYPDPKPWRPKPKPFRLHPRDVMPSMRAWADKAGILIQPFEIDL